MEVCETQKENTSVRGITRNEVKTVYSEPVYRRKTDNGQKKRDKWMNNDRQSTTQTTKD